MNYAKIYNIQRFPAVQYNTDRKALSLHSAVSVPYGRGDIGS